MGCGVSPTARSRSPRRCCRRRGHPRSRSGTTSRAERSTRASTTPGSTALRLLLDAVVADRAAALSASAICCSVTGSRNGARHPRLQVDAAPTQLPAKQSACSSSRTESESGRWSWRSRPLLMPAMVLDVVAPLVRDDVHLGQRPAVRAELRAQLREERRCRGRWSGRRGSRTGRRPRSRCRIRYSLTPSKIKTGCGCT